MISASAAPPYPVGQLGHPVAAWFFDDVQPILWGAAFVVVVVHTARTRRFAITSLLFLAGTTMFWIEWPADWGSYLVYNRDFRLFDGWTSTWYQTYWKPIGVVFGYGVFFGIAGIVLSRGVPAVRRRITALPQPAAVAVVAAVLFYAFDIGAEKLMTSLGWYSYVEPVGPSWSSSRGSLSFVWPALPFVLFAVCLALLLDHTDDRGFYRVEVIAGASRVGAGWRRESRRLVAWIVTMNVLIFVFQPLVLCIGRSLFLHGSSYVP